MFLRTRVVSGPEYWAAHALYGSVYFLRDRSMDAVKIGYSRDVARRLVQLQTANSTKLELIGAIAAVAEIEELIHFQLMEGRIRGEWFWDRGVTTQWLMDMTRDQPLYRNIWELIPSTPVFNSWDENTHSHTKHRWNNETKEWMPPIPQQV